MATAFKQFIVNDIGEQVSVVLPIKEYQHMLEQLEDLEDIRLYDEAKASREPAVPVEEAFEFIEAQRS